MKYAVSITVLVEAESRTEAVSHAEDFLNDPKCMEGLAYWQFQEINTVVEAE